MGLVSKYTKRCGGRASRHGRTSGGSSRAFSWAGGRSVLGFGVAVRHDVSTSAKLAAACGTSAAALALAVPVVASAARPGYDHCRQFISELG